MPREFINMATNLVYELESQYLTDLVRSLRKDLPYMGNPVFDRAIAELRQKIEDECKRLDLSVEEVMKWK